MAFIKIIIAVAYFLHVCYAQVSNGQPFNPSFKFNTFGDSEKTLQTITDNANFRRNYINFAANHLSQSKFAQNRMSDFYNQKTPTPLENYQNNIFPQSSNQQLSNLRQQINGETQDLPNPLTTWNTRQEPNLGNNIKVAPPNELPVTSNILPAPNIASNSFLVSNVPNTQSIINPSLTISTSLPPFIPKAFPNANYIKLQSTNQVPHDTNPNRVFVALAEPPKATNTNSRNYYYVPPNPDANSEKSLNMKTLLPLILKLLNDDNEDCPCCRCNGNNNLADIPLIDSGYSKQKIYGSPPDDSYEDSESEEEDSEMERKKINLHKNRDRKHKYHRHHSNEEKESQSNEY